MEKWGKGDVDVNGIKIHYRRTGGDKPPFILLHGITDSGRTWAPVAEVLAETYDVIMPDAYGHGLSARIDSNLPKQSHVDHLCGLIDALGLERPLMMGHSMGAGTVADIASQYPDLPGAIVLEDPAWRDLDPAISAEEIAAGKKRSLMVRRWMGIMQQKSRDELITHQRKNNPAWSEAELEPWAESKLEFDRSFYTAMRASHATYREVVSKITCPVLLVSGDPALGGIVTPGVAENACRIWNNTTQSHWVRIQGAGHSVRREQFKLFCDALLGFLSGIG